MSQAGLHPLTKLLYPGWENDKTPWNYDRVQQADKIIRTYLAERAEWLKKEYPSFTVGTPTRLQKDIDQAFELEGTAKPKPALPRKFEIYGRDRFVGDEWWKISFQEKINDLIDFLHSREGE